MPLPTRPQQYCDPASLVPLADDFPVFTLAFLFELHKHESRKNATKHAFT